MSTNYQRIWDESLIQAYRDGVRLFDLARLFIRRVDPAMSNEESNKIYAFIDGLELRRCRDRNRDGSLSLQKRNMSVSSFVGARCQRLSSCALNRDLSIVEIVDNISSFKWVRKNMRLERNKASRKHHRKKIRDGEVRIKARDLTASNNWNTVK